MMTFDPNDQFFQHDDDSQAQDDDQKNSKDVQLYKDTMVLLKKKMCPAQNFLQQLNDKVNEFNDLNKQLRESKLEKDKLFIKYNSMSEKVTRLELANRDYEKSWNNYKNTTEKQELEIDEKKKHIEQLEFKIKEMERNHSYVKDEIKRLQHETKISKSIAKKATKNQAIQTNCKQQQDASVNTDFKTPLLKRPHVKDKSIMTDETISFPTEPFSMFDPECKSEVDDLEVGQILKIMSSHPPLLSSRATPPRSPRSMPSSPKKFEPIASDTFEQYIPEHTELNGYDEQTIETTCRVNEKSDEPSCMLMEKLSKKISDLEQLVKKKTKRQKRNNCCHQSCCPSKNIKFVVQLPNEGKYIQNSKHHKQKQPHLKRLNKQRRLKNKKEMKTREWLVENNIDIEDIELSPKRKKDQQENKCKDSVNIDKTDLFESPAIITSNSSFNHHSNQVSYTSDNNMTLAGPTLHNQHSESFSVMDISTDESVEHLTNQQLVSDDTSETKYNLLSRVSSPVLAHKFSDEKVAEEKTEKIDDFSEKTLPTFHERNSSLDVLTEVNTGPTVEINKQSSNDTGLIAKECSTDEIMDSLNQDMTCQSIERENSNDEIAGLETNTDLQLSDRCIETISPSFNDRRLSNSSVLSSENATSLTDVCVSKDESDNSNIAKKVSEEKEIIVNILEEHSVNDVQEEDCMEITKIFEKSQSQIGITSDHQVVENNSPRSPCNIVKNIPEEQVDLNDKIRKNTEENDPSLQDSKSSKVFVASGVKRDKCSNPTLADESCEEKAEKSNLNKRKKILIATRKKLISKIRNLKKLSKIPMNPIVQMKEMDTSLTPSIPTETSSKEIGNSSTILTAPDTLPCIPTKKQRVAHKPNVSSEKSQIAFVDRSQSPEDATDVDKCYSRKELSSKPRIRNSIKKAEDSPRETKRMKLMKSNELQQLAVSSLAKPESILIKAEPVEIKVNGKENIEMSINASNVDKNDFEEKQVQEKFGESSNIDPSNIHNNKTLMVTGGTDHNNSNVESLSDTNEDASTIDQNREKIAERKLRSRQVVIEEPTRRTSRRLKGSSPSSTKSDTDANSCSTSNAEPASPVAKKSPNKKNTTGTRKAFIEKFDCTNSSLPDTVMVSHLNNFLVHTNRENKEAMYGHLKKNDKYIRTQLTSLFSSEPLTTDVLSEVSENLSSISEIGVVALVLVEYAATEYLHDVMLDKTYTPPAPLLTKFEQKLITLLMSIKEKRPEISDAVENGLIYKLFRLGKPQEVQIVERLFRILVVLSKIKKDREKVRMFCCDALYCFNIRAMNVIYVALTCWPEVFPKHGSNNDILAKTIVHIIMSVNVNRPFSKLMPLKKLLTTYYEYPESGFRVETFKQELLKNLQKNVPGVNTAILLLCKSKGAEWTLQNVIRGGLKQMIVSQVHPSMYDALTLLGNLIRPFSAGDLKSSIEEITDQLCDVLAGNPGSRDLEEGIVSCLLSVGSKFSFKREKIAQCVLAWHFSQELRPTTEEKFNSFLKTHTPGWWRKFVQQHFPVAK